MGLGAASVKAQVRIGGNTPPNPAAALDLNTAEGTTAGTKGLALPRVTLSSNTATLDGTTANINGMLVYNTSGTLSAGVYYWSGTNWNRVDGATLGGDTIVGNEVTGATPSRGLTIAGSGTVSSPLTLGIAPHGVDTSMIKVMSTANTFLMSTPNGWKPVAFAKFYDSGGLTAGPNVIQSHSVNFAGCVDELFVSLLTLDGTSTPGYAFSNMAPTIYTWSATGGSWQVIAFCLKLL